MEKLITRGLIWSIAVGFTWFKLVAVCAYQLSVNLPPNCRHKYNTVHKQTRHPNSLKLGSLWFYIHVHVFHCISELHTCNLQHTLNNQNVALITEEHMYLYHDFVTNTCPNTCTYYMRHTLYC